MMSASMVLQHIMFALRRYRDTSISVAELFGQLGILFWECLKSLWKDEFQWRATIDQIHQIGNRSFWLIFITAFAIGAVMTLQFGHGLAKFGGKLYIPKVVSLSVVRELSPVFTAIMMAGRVGSGIAAEVGSMAVTQQIDAMRALGTNPIARIVVPRMVALFLAVPALTIMSIFISLLGALIICSTELGIPHDFFIIKVVTGITLADVLSGVAKTFVFAVLIGLVACYRGLNTKGGTRGVGDSTTWVVVVSSICIYISDLLLTKLFLWVETIL